MNNGVGVEKTGFVEPILMWSEERMKEPDSGSDIYQRNVMNIEY